MLEAKLLPNNQIKTIQMFISDIYAHQRQWYFSLENSLNSKLEIKEDDNSVWFGILDNEKLVAAANICISNEKTISAKYTECSGIYDLIKSGKSVEITHIVLDPQYSGQKIIQLLFLEIFKYCTVNHYDIFTCSYDSYLKSFYTSIKFPLKTEGVFQHKFADQELSVNFYFAGYETQEIKTAIGSLELWVADSTDHLHHDSQHERDKFQKVVDQVLHDIRSPLSSLSMIVGICNGIPEEDRVALRSAINRINDIGNNLQNEYGKKGVPAGKLNIEKYDSLLVSTALLEVLGEKRYQYKLLNVRFEHSFSQNSNFAFTTMDNAVFKRMMSNVLNNAVDAVDQNNGIVTIRLSLDHDLIKIVVQDNGRGMSQHLIDQIMGNLKDDKSSSHQRSGLMQVRHTLEENHGTLSITSEAELGSKVTLSFPKISMPNWLADRIELNGDDLVVILDDEPSIHGAWNSRFRLHTKRVAIKHFESGREVINFINYLPLEKQKKIFLLADYELQNQDVDGLAVIEQTKSVRSLLVTSHYANRKLRADVEALGIKLLPKMLAPEVIITVDAKIEPAEGKKEVSMIFADDDKEFVTNMIRSLFAGQYVETFFDPEHLLQDILKYKKDTKICLDNHFEKSGIRGVEVAERLYEKGFTNLYMLSGNLIDAAETPPYLRVILKNDLDGIRQMRDA